VKIVVRESIADTQVNEAAVQRAKTGEKAEIRLDILEQLDYLSLGYKTQECADLCSISYDRVGVLRKLGKKFFDARNLRQTIAMAIQQGYIGVEVESDPEFEPLSPRQEAVLRWQALGWEFNEIADKYGLTSSTVNSHYGEIRRKLKALDMKHALRRAYELGIFKLDEEIASPDDLEKDRLDQRDRGLVLSIGRLSLKPSELGIYHHHQISILEILMGLGLSHFRRSDIYSEGFFNDAESENARAHAFGRAIMSIIRKLDDAAGEKIIEKVGGKGSISYVFRQQVSIRRGEESQVIPAYQGDESALWPMTQEQRNFKRRQRSQVVSKKRARKSRKKDSEKSGTEQVNGAAELQKTVGGLSDYVDPETLPVIDEELLQGLSPRNPQEVLENDELKLAIISILQRGSFMEHRPKLIAALRFGINPSKYKGPMTMHRGEQVIHINEIMEYVPAYQGLDVESASKLSGLHPRSVISSELEFLSKHKDEFPAIKDLIARLSNQLNEKVVVVRG
jgi:DNA-binding CsgD family transcriptional regulator